jgi:hypothetical protein
MRNGKKYKACDENGLPGETLLNLDQIKDKIIIL